LALALHRQTRDEGALCDTLITMAAVERQIGRGDEAVRTAKQAVDLGEGSGDSSRRCKALEALGDALTATGQTATARSTYEVALNLLEELQDPGLRRLRVRLAASRDSLDAA
jgi:hypothetical protein